MSVRFKFKNDLEFVTLPCDGYNISVKDLKRAIIRSRHLGRVTDFDLTVSNNQTGEVYNNEEELIPKNSTLVVARHPLPSGQKKEWEEETLNQTSLAGITGFSSSDAGGSVASIVATLRDSSDPTISEDAKLQTMMSNSSEMYDQKNWKTYRGKAAFAGRPLPKNLRCSKCNQHGHFPSDCTFGEVKKTTGIPRSFLKPASAETLGAKMNPHGMFMVNELEQKAYSTAKIEKPMWEQEERPPTSANIVIPDDLKCPVCNELLRDAVMMPACACAMCDECARDTLIQSVNNACPSCNTPDNSPDDLIPWREQRKKVSKFRADNGLPSGDSPQKQSLELTRKIEEKPVLPEIPLPNFNDVKFDAVLADSKNGRPASAHTMFPSPEHSSSSSSHDSPTGISPRGRRERSSSSSSSSSSNSGSTSSKESQGTPTEKSPSPSVAPDVRSVPVAPKRMAPSHAYPPPNIVRLPDTSLPPPGFQIGPPLSVPVMPHRFPVTLPPTVPTHHPPPFGVVPGGMTITYGVPQMAPIDLLRDKDGYVTDPLAAFNAAMLRKDRRHRRSRSPPPHYKRKFSPPRRRKSQSPQRVPRGPRTPPHPPMSPSHDHSPRPRSISPGRSPNRSPGLYHHGSPLGGYVPETRERYGYPPPPRRDYPSPHDDYRNYSGRSRGYRNRARGSYRRGEPHYSDRSYSGERSYPPQRSSHHVDKDYREKYPPPLVKERDSRARSKSGDRTPSLSPEQDSKQQHRTPLEDPVVKEVESLPATQTRDESPRDEGTQVGIDSEPLPPEVAGSNRGNKEREKIPQDVSHSREGERHRHDNRRHDASEKQHDSRRFDDHKDRRRNDPRDHNSRREENDDRRRPDIRREDDKRRDDQRDDRKQENHAADSRRRDDRRRDDHHVSEHRRSNRDRDEKRRNNQDDRRQEDHGGRRRNDERESRIKTSEANHRSRDCYSPPSKTKRSGQSDRDRGHVERDQSQNNRSRRSRSRDRSRENIEEGDRTSPAPSDGEPKRKKSRKSLSETDLKEKKKKRKKKKSETERVDKIKKKKLKKDNLQNQQELAEPRVETEEESGVPEDTRPHEDSVKNDESVAEEFIQIHADKSEILDIDFKINPNDTEKASEEMAPIPISKWENDETDEDMKTSETESKEMKRKHQQFTHTNLNDVLREKVPAPRLERSQEKTKVAIEVSQFDVDHLDAENRSESDSKSDPKKGKKKKKDKKKKKGRDRENEDSSAKKKRHQKIENESEDGNSDDEDDTKKKQRRKTVEPEPNDHSKRKKKRSGDKDDHERKAKKKRKKEKFEQEAIRSLVMAITENGLKPELIAKILKKNESPKRSPSRSRHTQRLSPRPGHRESSTEGSPVRHHKRDVKSNGRHISVSITKQSSNDRSRRRSRSQSPQRDRSNRESKPSKNEKAQSPRRPSLKDRLGPKVSESRITRDGNRSRDSGLSRGRRTDERSRKN